MINFDDRYLGEYHPDGSVKKNPVLHASGAGFTKPTTRVRVGERHFYTLQPGLGIAPTELHAALVALAQQMESPASARGRGVKPEADPTATS